MITDALIDKIAEKKNPTVAGLDPQLDFIPSEIFEKHVGLHGETLEAASAMLYEFNTAIIDAISDLVPAVKLQSAMYEQFGAPGVKCYADCTKYAKKQGLIVIGDVKRGDIASSASFYSEAHLGEVRIGKSAHRPFDSDFITVNPYLGADSVTPFLCACEKYDKGIFVLVKTSNAGGGRFQGLIADGASLYEHVGAFVEEAGGASFIGKYGYSSVGAVVGATYPLELAQLRRLMPRTFFLIPGYGAQGARASDITGAFDKNGAGAIVNSSRGIIAAHKKSGGNVKDAARAAAINMRKDLQSAIGGCFIK